jgi:hypothetical protein
MNEFLNSLKDDLLDRRLLPIVALAVAGLVAAGAYLALGGGSKAAAPAPAPTIARTSTGIAVTPSPASPAQAVAETTSGSTAQSRGRAHNPFNPLPGDVKAAAATSTKSTSSTSSTTTSSKSGSSGKGEAKAEAKGETKPSSPSKPSTPSKPSKPTIVYHVSALFGGVPSPVPPTGVQLTPYESLKLLSPLPSAGQPLIVFRGVTRGGKSAAFTLVGEAILHGTATCLPSTAQCLLLELKPGQSEQLEYLPPGGSMITYELRIVSIKSSKASSATARVIAHGASKAGREVLRRAGLVAIPGLRNSSAVGVLTFAAHAASGARAHVALQQRRSR